MIGDRELGEALAGLPVDWLVSIREHLAKGQPMCVDYGWEQDARVAACGCPVGVAISREQYEYLTEGSEVDSDDYRLGLVVRRVADEAFPAWAARYVKNAADELPTAARERLGRAIDFALSAVEGS